VSIRLIGVGVRQPRTHRADDRTTAISFVEGPIMVSLHEVSGLASTLRLRLDARRMPRHTDPQHRSIMVIDIADFGRRDDLAQIRARAGLDRVVRSTFHASGIPWRRLVTQDRGDGMIVLIPATTSKAALLHPFVPRLSALLHDANRRVRPDHRLRVRVAVHAGEVVQGPYGWIGTDVNLACRLVDSAPLRQELVRRPQAELALVVSETIHRAVVRHGHRGVDPTAYGPVDITVKEVVTTAWLYRD
jgi:class 3 adenylate cyclase